MLIRKKREKKQEQRLEANKTIHSMVFGRINNKVSFFIFSFFFLLSSFEANAQCAMCRAALEGEGNKATAEAVNDGIVYLMIIPYLLVGVIFWYVYNSRKNLKKKAK